MKSYNVFFKMKFNFPAISNLLFKAKKNRYSFISPLPPSALPQTVKGFLNRVFLFKAKFVSLVETKNTTTTKKGGFVPEHMLVIKCAGIFSVFLFQCQVGYSIREFAYLRIGY